MKELDQFLISKSRKRTKEVVYLEQGKDWLNRLVFFYLRYISLKAPRMAQERFLINRRAITGTIS